MRYCVDYKRDFKYLKEVDELNIVYNRKDTSLLEFLLLYKDKRINIAIHDESDFIDNECIKLFDAFKEQYPELNFVFKLNSYRISRDLFEIIKASEQKYKVFFDEFVRDWDTLNGYLELGVSDVYIVEELGFEIENAAAVAHAHNTQIRVFPNVAQSSWNRSPALRKFFIRPEDVDIYESYVDVMEFFARTDNPDSIATYYKIYAIDKKWFGKLNEMILSFDNDIDSRCILSIFAERRLNCGKRCSKGRPCNVCGAIEQLSATLEEQQMIITKPKK
jgi:hypothetical protein